MRPFARHEGVLRCDGVDLEAIAREVGTPVYVYSARWIAEACQAYSAALAPLPGLIAYAVKANTSLAILRRMAALGLGAEVTSGFELQRARRAGIPGDRVVISGVGKTDDEMRLGLSEGVRAFHVESRSELERLARVAADAGVRAPVGIRVNPDVDAETHTHIATGREEDKFGIPHGRALEAFEAARAHDTLEVVGLHVHIGSQITGTGPFLAALDRVEALLETLRTRGFALRHLDLGGGMAIRYRDEEPVAPAELFAALKPRLEALGLDIIVEPGRALVGPAGALLTKVLVDKPTDKVRFVVVDGAMNDLVRPAMYDAWHEIVPVRARSGADPGPVDVVGPVCESADAFARGRRIGRVAEGDLLCVLDAGAYGMSMASNYNSRPRPPEVLVHEGGWSVIRRRETLMDLMRLELEAGA